MFNKTEKVQKEIDAKIKDEESEKTMAKYIFDPNKVMKVKSFTFLKMDEDTCGFGQLLPKEAEIKNQKGKLIGTIQEFSPAIITSNNRILEVYTDSLKEQNIRFKSIPEELDLRWSLPSIKKFLKKKYGKVDGVKLFTKIRRKYEKYLYFQKNVWYEIHAIWDIGTYFYMLFQAYPINELRGLKGSAKTKTMTVSRSITMNATKIMINPSEATLFRETHDKRPTKYIDEAEKLFIVVKGKAIPDPRVEVINSSYSRGSTVPRQEKIGNRYKTVYYDTYSPTMIGSINGLYGATEDRAIIHTMVKNPATDQRGDLEPPEESEERREIRDSLYIFALQNWQGIENIYNSMKNETKLKSRDYQIWKPILAIARYLEIKTYENIKRYAEKATEIKKHTGIAEGSLEFHIIKIMHELLDTENKQKQVCILYKDVKQKLPEHYSKSHSKTISKHLDSFGCRDNFIHTNKGNGIAISFEEFEVLVTTIFPSFSSLHSQDIEILHDKINEEYVEDVNESEEKQEKVKKKSEANEANERNEADIELKVEIVEDTKPDHYKVLE